MGPNFDWNYKHNSKHGAGLAFVTLALAFVINVGKKDKTTFMASPNICPLEGWSSWLPPIPDPPSPGAP